MAKTSISVAWIAVVLFILLDIFLIYWIGKVKANITNIQSNESTMAPLYFCDFYTDPTTGNQEPGSLCYIEEPGGGNQMVAYRYTDDNNFECQKTRVSNNIILTDQTWLTPQTLASQS